MEHTSTSSRIDGLDEDRAAGGNWPRGPGKPNAAKGPICCPAGDDKPRILIVDDSLTVRMDLRQTFEAAEFDVTLCETLAAARAALARQMPALVVLDVLLPDGDGIDWLREIKSTLSPALPVMLLSTEAEVRDRVRGLKKIGR